MRIPEKVKPNIIVTLTKDILDVLNVLDLSPTKIEIVKLFRNRFVFIVVLRTSAFYKTHVLKQVTC